MTEPVSPGYTNGAPRQILRLEGFALFLASIGFYMKLGAGWKLFAILILVPDLSFAAFVFGPRAGAFAYNTMHSTLGPIATMAVGYLLPQPMVLAIGLIWAAHVGIDRSMGYGLKYPSAFGDTHLGRIGRRKEVTA